MAGSRTGTLIRSPEPESAESKELRARLDAFYQKTESGYTAFSSAGPGNQTPYHDHIVHLIKEFLASGREASKRVRVLELGAGRTTFAENLGDLRAKVDFHVQDVTAVNSDWLADKADRVHIGDISAIDERFDIVFSTYVFEHVATPADLLRHVKRLLVVGGYHVIFCPRYDLLGYICPSLRHRSRGWQVLHTLWLFTSRLVSRLDRTPRFWVNTDPSLFHGPWFRDADAIHLVSRVDAELWHRSNGFSVRRLPLPSGGGWKSWILTRFLTLSNAFRREVD